MPTFSQEHRPLKITTPLGPDVLLLAGFSGVEAISTPFEWMCDLLSDEEDIAAADLLRKPVTVEIETGPETKRFFHGRVREFAQFGLHNKLVSYQMKVVPALWFLKLTGDCKIFQHMSVPDIVDKVLKAHGVNKVEWNKTKNYAPREYCVQYRESHFDFISRLLEEEGIHYYFEHTEDGDEEILWFHDDATAAKACPGAVPARMAVSPQPWQEEEVVVELTSTFASHTGKIALRDYDPLQPNIKLESEAGSKEPGEWYDYPGHFTKNADGTRYAKVQLEEAGSRYQVIQGDSNCRYFVTGHKFELKDHYRSDLNTAYHLVEVRHSARSGDFQTWDSAPFDYRNSFVAVPIATKFRPPHEIERPRIGVHTAVVVGPAGEEIHTDEHGRVKVQFHWDRDGKNDEESSCWVRVASTWAGTGWGFIQLPRIGQEVVVDFLEGDPDYPLIIGSVYNAVNVPPYALPANRTQSGVKSRSSLKGESANYNEIRFEDKKGAELITIHAEKDKEVVVEHDRNEKVGHDETYSIGHDQSIDVGNDQQISIGSNRTESVGKDESITIDGSRTESVHKDETITIDKNRTESVGKDENVAIGQHRTVTVAKNETTNIGETRSVEVGKDDSLKVGKKFLLDAGDEVTLKTGSASITMKKDGTITIKGKDITIDASGKINAKAGGDVVMKGSKVLSN
jgi:type VI secretion system secreted protein VgrG